MFLHAVAWRSTLGRLFAAVVGKKTPYLPIAKSLQNRKFEYMYVGSLGRDATENPGNPFPEVPDISVVS